ncbi:poly(ethylene terephthalate) hydrolase family protein [Glutamicibacter halophytocola]|uniref:poly(ethylene terephthalate) hydrolase family protein n=1 Tax=Glutamicibacter halophytocola TaxID=1933880 RepID=UPI0040392FFA
MAAFRVSRTWPFGPSTSGITIAKHSIVWLNQFIDTGARYDQFLCPHRGPPRTSASTTVLPVHLAAKRQCRIPVLALLSA